MFQVRKIKDSKILYTTVVCGHWTLDLGLSIAIRMTIDHRLPDQFTCFVALYVTAVKNPTNAPDKCDSHEICGSVGSMP